MGFYFASHPHNYGKTYLDLCVRIEKLKMLTDIWSDETGIDSGLEHGYLLVHSLTTVTQAFAHVS